MGFEREKIIEAFQASNNDVVAAMETLLAGLSV